jgi:Family of unknown function (DUF6982)
MPFPPVSNDKMNRVVVAFLDGRRLKGYLFNFSALKESFRLFPSEPEEEKSGSDVYMKDLKAVFFVKDLTGDQGYKETPGAGEIKHGRKVVVTFQDGEELSGATDAYNAQKLGFFMFPLDPKSNNLRIFVVNKNVRQVALK